MKQVTKQYQSDFDLDTKVIQKAAKEAKADGKPSDISVVLPGKRDHCAGNLTRI